MAYRSILISQATKINLDLNNIVVYSNDEKYYINLDEISLIVLEDPRCLVSLKLLTEIGEKGISMVFTNASHMPVCSIDTMQNNARSSKRYKEQIEWDKLTTNYLWIEIVKQKIKLQEENLILSNKSEKAYILDEYIKEIKDWDYSNREGLASRIYFKEYFGTDFKRFNEDIINFSLNYAYQILRAKISQEIVSLGYNPCLGINHRSEYNSFNLADDFIEPYRPIVDFYVKKILECSTSNYLTPDIKKELVNIMNQYVLYDGKKQKIHISLGLYIQGIIYFLNTGDKDRIKFPDICNGI